MTDHVTGKQARELLEYPDNAAPWFIEMHNLAETVAWLYGKPLTADTDGDFYEAPHGGYTDAEDGMVDVNISQGPFTPDEAVEVARALLAAAEEARGHK